MVENKTFQELLKQTTYSETISVDVEPFELADAEDVEILLHRDIHFEASFDKMLRYYHLEGKGVQKDIYLPRVEELYQIERSANQNLASLLLTHNEREKIAQMGEMYRILRATSRRQEPKYLHLKLLADLILSESVEAKEEIDAIVAQGPAIVKSLTELVTARDFYDPLSPGYGVAPTLAIHALRRLADPSATAALFEAIDLGDFECEEAIFQALVAVDAKHFLLNLLARPITKDNERAARALTHFSFDEEVAQAALTELQDLEICRKENLAGYLILCCEGLSDPLSRKKFADLKKRVELQALHQDIQAIVSSWNSEKYIGKTKRI